MERVVVFIGSFVLMALFLILFEGMSDDHQPSIDTLKTALHSPDDESMATVIAYGTDSRYNTIVSGWARYELSGVQSQLGIRSGNRPAEHLLKKEQFLTEVIRRIDLE